MAVVRELFDLRMTRDNVRHLLDQWRKTAKKRPTFARWFNPLRILRPGTEWLIVVDDRDWFVKYDGKGWIRTGEDPLLPPERKIPQARRVIAINLTKIKEKTAGTLQ
jgi:hypothetical protein